MAILGRDPANYGEHSERRGGATTASEAGVSWLDLKRHGRWASDSSAQRYIEDADKKANKVPAALAAVAVKTEPDQKKRKRDQDEQTLERKATKFQFQETTHQPATLPAGPPPVRRTLLPAFSKVPAFTSARMMMPLIRPPPPANIGQVRLPRANIGRPDNGMIMARNPGCRGPFTRKEFGTRMDGTPVQRIIVQKKADKELSPHTISEIFKEGVFTFPPATSGKP